MSKILLRTYKMTYDTGFAPNPYCGVLTLATCKPGIRGCAKPGEWIAGFTSEKLCGDPPGHEKLIYLMQVAEKLRFEDYYDKYPQKRPENFICGDNIYRRGNNGYEQLDNPYHHKCDLGTDTSEPYVLLATEFYYFGRDAVSVPKEYRPNVKVGPAPYGTKTEGEQARIFIEWVKKVAAKGQSGLIGKPHQGSQPDSCSKVKGRCQ
jgi:hypothetical protein